MNATPINPAAAPAPSGPAIRAALVMRPSEASTLAHPSRYAFTLDGKVSQWPAECRAEVDRVARQIDTATGLPGLLDLLTRAADSLDSYCANENGDLNDSLATEIRAALQKVEIQS